MLHGSGMDRRLLIATAIAILIPPTALAAGGGAKKISGSESYIQIEPVLGTRILSSGRRGVLAIECGLDVKDPALRARSSRSPAFGPPMRRPCSPMPQAWGRNLCPTPTTSPPYSSVKPT